MSIVVRSTEEAALHRHLKSPYDLAVHEFRSDLATKVNGIFDIVEGHLVAVFVSADQIFVRLDEVAVSLQSEGTQVRYGRDNAVCTFSVLGGDGQFAEITYQIPSDPVLTEQPFHYVDDSDLDIGLAIHDIASSLQRQRQLMLTWR